ncbi:MAG: RHS repeat-associated core domain-containing protein [Actinomycetota bacterium]
MAQVVRADVGRDPRLDARPRQGTVGYGYDAAGSTTQMTVTGQAPTGYTWDEADRLTQLTRGPLSVGKAYDNAGRLASVTLPNGVTETYGYGPASHLASIGYQGPAQTLGDLAYGYDKDGRRSRVSGSYARSDVPPALSSASYDPANRITTRAGATFAYDANGNLTGDGVKTYTWGGRNLLTGITSGGTTASFGYDASGRRVAVTVNGQTTRFLHDGDTPVRELDGTGAPAADLLVGPGTDEFYARTDPLGVTTSHLTDALGSTIALTGPLGVVTTEYSYDPFGRASTTGVPSANRYQYTGRDNDGTGLQYNRARYYSPDLGRFLSEDPIGFQAGDVNLYAYVNNAPCDSTDPTGLAPQPSPGRIGKCTNDAASGAPRILFTSMPDRNTIRWDVRLSRKFRAQGLVRLRVAAVVNGNSAGIIYDAERVKDYGWHGRLRRYYDQGGDSHNLRKGDIVTLRVEAFGLWLTGAFSAVRVRARFQLSCRVDRGSSPKTN